MEGRVVEAGGGKALCPKKDANVLGLGFSRCWVRVTEIVYKCECFFFFFLFFFLVSFLTFFSVLLLLNSSVCSKVSNFLRFWGVGMVGWGSDLKLVKYRSKYTD